nr:MAG TPA: hypothetical protein [Caudoviricetes sp.]
MLSNSSPLNEFSDVTTCIYCYFVQNTFIRKKMLMALFTYTSDWLYSSRRQGRKFSFCMYIEIVSLRSFVCCNRLKHKYLKNKILKFITCFYLYLQQQI